MSSESSWTSLDSESDLPRCKPEPTKDGLECHPPQDARKGIDNPTPESQDAKKDIDNPTEYPTHLDWKALQSESDKYTFHERKRERILDAIHPGWKDEKYEFENPSAKERAKKAYVEPPTYMDSSTSLRK